MFFFKPKPDVLNDPLIMELDEITESVNYAKPANAGILLEQAKINLKGLEDSIEQLEKKADDLIRYLGVGTGLAGMFLNYSRCYLGTAGLIVFLVGIVAWGISMALAWTVRRPRKYGSPGPIDKALFFMRDYGDSPEALNLWLSLSYEKAALTNLLVGRQKGDRLNAAFFFLGASLFLFMLSFALRVIFPL